MRRRAEAVDIPARSFLVRALFYASGYRRRGSLGLHLGLKLSAMCLGLACAVMPGPASAQRANCLIPDLGLALAGPDVIDYGIAPMGMSWWKHRRHQRWTLKCMRKALEKGRPVRYGAGFIGFDHYGCDVIVIDKNGVPWLLVYGWDLSVPDATERVFVGRCPRVDPGWHKAFGSEPYQGDDCEFDAEAFEQEIKRAVPGR